MATYISTGGNAASADLGASLERLARASAAAGFAMVEGPPEEAASDARNDIRSSWHGLEDYFGRLLILTGNRPRAANAWQ